MANIVDDHIAIFDGIENDIGKASNRCGTDAGHFRCLRGIREASKAGNDRFHGIQNGRRGTDVPFGEIGRDLVEVVKRVSGVRTLTRDSD